MDDTGNQLLQSAVETGDGTAVAALVDWLLEQQSERGTIAASVVSVVRGAYFYFTVMQPLQSARSETLRKFFVNVQYCSSGWRQRVADVDGVVVFATKAVQALRQLPASEVRRWRAAGVGAGEE
jgi:hypothetical protein